MVMMLDVHGVKRALHGILFIPYFRISFIRANIKWGKSSLLLLSHSAPVKVRYKSLQIRLAVLYYHFLSCLITIWRCQVSSPTIFGHNKRNSKVFHEQTWFPKCKMIMDKRTILYHSNQVNCFGTMVYSSDSYNSNKNTTNACPFTLSPSSCKGPNILKTLDSQRLALTNQHTCNISDIIIQAYWLANARRQTPTTKSMQRAYYVSIVIWCFNPDKNG